MLQRQSLSEDLFASHTKTSREKTTQQWEEQFRGCLPRRLRVPRARITRLRITALLLCVLVILLLQKSIFTYEKHHSSPTRTSNRQPLEVIYGSRQAVDTFARYKYRSTCNISSLDLHVPSQPLCQTRTELLRAMSGGGRIGLDAPYTSRGCDMQWFTSEEVCKILAKFDRVVLVGDSMLRHVIGSINILVRQDIGYGAVTDWNFSEEERAQCFCNEQFDVKACSVQGIYKTSDVMQHDPKSLKCSRPINVIMEEIVRYPVPLSELTALRDSIGLSNTKEHIAFILGHGLWSDLDIHQSLRWVDVITATINTAMDIGWHGIFITPNASGKKKPAEWEMSQGNRALMLFEEKMGQEVHKRGFEHLGTWNMSVQANLYDGVHMDMKGNLVKAMMVLNWLNMLPTTNT